MKKRKFQVPGNKWNGNFNVILNYPWWFFFLFCSHLEMVIFKDVFILSRTFIENLPCVRHYAKQWLYIYNRTWNKLGIMGCKHKAILSYLPLSLIILLNLEDFFPVSDDYFITNFNRNFYSYFKLLTAILVQRLNAFCYIINQPLNLT